MATRATGKPRSPLLAELRQACLAFPEAVEVEAWGHPTFRVGGKIFAAYGFHEGRPNLGIKAEKGLQEVLVDGKRFFRTPYVGQHGWVSAWVDQPVDWKLIQDLIAASYRLVAPKRLASGLQDKTDSKPAGSRKTASPDGKRKPGSKQPRRKS